MKKLVIETTRMGDGSIRRVKPLARVKPSYDRPLSVYPDTLMVPMSDGRVVAYRIDVEQPHPAFAAVMGLLEKLPYGPSAKGYRGRHETEKE